MVCFHSAQVFVMKSDGQIDLAEGVNCTDNVARVGGGCLYSAGRAVIGSGTLMEGNRAENGGCLCEHGGGMSRAPAGGVARDAGSS